MASRGLPRARLLVLVTPSCGGCGRAVQLAADFAHERPDVEVHVVDVTRGPLPDGVILVGTPMYVDDTGTPVVLSLGNPPLADLLRHYEGVR